MAAPEQHDTERPERSPVQRARVLVVDDSALMRRLLSDLLKTAPEIEVVGTARDGRDAVLQATRLKPDVITLDVEMPEASGIDALPLLLGIGGLGVVMVSALTQEGAEVTLRALELGAFDFMPKPEKNQLAELRANSDLLIGKVLAAAASGRRKKPRQRHASTAAGEHTQHTEISSARNRKVAPAVTTPDQMQKPSRAIATQCVLIGISTGGPQQLARVFPELRPPCPPIVVVQHMPAQFTGVFAERLNRYTALTVKLAQEGDEVLADQVLIAPGGMHLMLKGSPPRVYAGLTTDPPVSGHRPSIDVLFHSGAKVYGRTAVGILMTGMGRDGVDGCKAILGAGGFTLGQDEESSAVYGMNKAAYCEGAVRSQFGLDELAGILMNIAAVRAAIEANASAGNSPDQRHGPQSEHDCE